MLSKLVNNLLLLTVIFILGCETENENPEVRTSPKKQRVMSRSTELKASPEAEMTITLEKADINQEDLERLFKDYFGINQVRTAKNSIYILYNPSFITPDSIKSILKAKSIPIKD